MAGMNFVLQLRPGYNTRVCVDTTEIARGGGGLYSARAVFEHIGHDER